MAERYRVLWSPVALDDLESMIEFFVEEAGLQQAVSLQEKIESRVAALASHPKRCRIVPELKALGVTTYRELILPPYRIFFRMDDDVVGITAVLDGRRDLDELVLLRGLVLDD
ncbi:MAG: type II toxin-antitoxin system RelE/ParE family toxin [Acidobacteriota bacterium]